MVLGHDQLVTVDDDDDDLLFVESYHLVNRNTVLDLHKCLKVILAFGIRGLDAVGLPLRDLDTCVPGVDLGVDLMSPPIEVGASGLPRCPLPQSIITEVDLFRVVVWRLILAKLRGTLSEMAAAILDVLASIVFGGIVVLVIAREGNLGVGGVP